MAAKCMEGLSGLFTAWSRTRPYDPGATVWFQFRARIAVPVDPSGPVDAKAFRAPDALRDGTPVCVRAIRPDDKERLLAGFRRLSARSIYRRFFHALPTLTAADLQYLTELDFRSHVGLAVTVGEGDDETFIAVGRFIRESADKDEAEVAFTVADDYQHRGAATLLLRHLACLGRRLGVRRFVAVVQTDNREMLDLLRHSGVPAAVHLGNGGVTRVVLQLE